jgi:hypothetical protein
MRADDFAAPAGNSFKFENVGDVIEGTVTYVGDFQEQVNKFNGNKDMVARIGVDTGNGDVQYVYPRKGSAMAAAIAQALRDAKVDELEPGQTLKLGYTDNKDTGKPQPMKVFAARITPAAARVPF